MVASSVAKTVAKSVARSVANSDSGGGFGPELLLFNSELDNAYWAKTAGSIDPNAVNAPDGSLTADTYIENSATAIHSLNANSVTIPAGTHRLSGMFRSNGRSWITFRAFGTIAYGGYLNIDTQALGLQPNATTTFQDLGGGWKKVNVDFVSTVAITSIQLWTSLNGLTATYLGDGVSGFHVANISLRKRQ